MDTLSAFARASGAQPMVFDWDKAAKLIKERKPLVASAGLSGDWQWTGGRIFECGAPVPKDETYTFLSSIWATPELDLDGKIIACWKYTDENDPNQWNSETYWPESALAILNS